MKVRCSKAVPCPELTPCREEDLCSLGFYVLSLRRHLSQHLLLCLEGRRQSSPSTGAENGSDFVCIPAVHTGSHICCTREFIVPCPRKLWVSVKWAMTHVCNRETNKAQENKKPVLSSVRSRWWTCTGEANLNSWGEWKTPPIPVCCFPFTPSRAGTQGRKKQRI